MDSSNWPARVVVLLVGDHWIGDVDIAGATEAKCIPANFARSESRGSTGSSMQATDGNVDQVIFEVSVTGQAIRNQAAVGCPGNQETKQRGGKTPPGDPESENETLSIRSKFA